MINAGTTDPRKRLIILRREAISQLKALENSPLLEHQFIESPNLPEKQESDFNKQLEGLLNVPPIKRWNELIVIPYFRWKIKVIPQIKELFNDQPLVERIKKRLPHKSEINSVQ